MSGDLQSRRALGAARRVLVLATERNGCVYDVNRVVRGHRRRRGFLVAPLVLVATLSPASADPSDAQVSASATSSREPDDWVQVEAPMVVATGDDGGTTVGAAPSIAASETT